MSSNFRRGTGGPGGTPLKEYGKPNTFGLAIAQKLAATGLTEAEYVQIAQRFKAKERLKQHIRYFKSEGFNITLENGRYVDKTEPSLSLGPSTPTQVFLNGEIPTKEDIDLAESQLRKNPDEIIGIETVLDQVEINFKKAGKSLKENWREITRKNIEIWFAAINCKKL